MFHLTMTTVSLLCLVVGIRGMYVNRIEIAYSTQMLRLVAIMAFLLIGAVFYHWRGAETLRDVFGVTFWGIAPILLLILLMYVGSRRPLEFQDHLLARLDRGMGLQVPDVLRWIREHPLIDATLTFCYYSLNPLYFVALLLPPLLGRMDVSKQLLVACFVTGIIALTTYAHFRAVGPWVSYPIPTCPSQATLMNSFNALYQEETYSINLESTPHLITFPSLHTAWAALFAFALWPFRYIRWPTVLFCTLIIISTVTTGWHYLTDVLGGLITAAAAAAVAKGYLWLETRCAGSPRQASSETCLSELAELQTTATA